MPKYRRMTDEEIAKNRAEIAAHDDKRRSDPQRVEIREWLKTAWKGDYEAVCDYAAAVMISAGELQEINEELQEALEDATFYLEGFRSTLDKSRDMAMGYLEVLKDSKNRSIQALIKGVQLGKSAAPRKNALKRHAEHRSMKGEVFDWLDKNMTDFKGLDKAADKIAGKVVPMPWRTVRDWVGQWKKLRSASKPSS